MQEHFKNPIRYQAIPLIADQYWIIKKNNQVVGSLRSENNGYFLNIGDYSYHCKSRERLINHFGNDFFQEIENKQIDDKNCLGYKTHCKPHSTMYNVLKHVPVFTKNDISTSLYCAGYYLLKNGDEWQIEFCPKMIVLDRNEFKGPFKTEEQAKKELNTLSYAKYKNFSTLFDEDIS